MKIQSFLKIKKSNWVFFFIVFFALNACDDVLEEEPRDQILTEDFFQNEADALLALTAAYARLKSGNGYYGERFLSAVFTASEQGTSSNLFNDFRTGTITSSDQNIDLIWRSIYFGIRDANNVIANMPNTTMNEALKARILGEARFLRALHYFNLVRCFGEVPLRTTPATQEDVNQGLPASSIVDIYSLIISDLLFAAENCWGRLETRNPYTNNLGRATKASAQALLAKVYLRIASCKRTAMTGVEGNAPYLDFPDNPESYYQLSKEQCDLATAQEGFQLVNSLDDWIAIFDADNGNNPEMIFDVQGSNLAGQGTAVSNLFTPRNAGLSGSGFGGTNKLRPSFINTRLNSNDNRYSNSIVDEYQNETRSFVINARKTGYIRTRLSDGEVLAPLFQVWTAKYIDTEATTAFSSRQNWHIVRLADVYLMRAEAMAEIAQDPAMANDDFNALRARVEMSNFNGSGMTMENFRTVLLEERAAELYMEGHRFFDITRMGVYDQYCQSAYGNVNGVRSPEDYFWPIPISEEAANDNID